MAEVARRQATVEEKELDGEAAEVEILNYVLGFGKMAVVKCAMDLGIAEAIENHGSPVTLSELSSAIECDPSLLERLMRFLVHHRIFKEKPTGQGPVAFELTPLSRLLLKQEENSIAPLILYQNTPVMVSSLLSLSGLLRTNGGVESAFEVAHGKHIFNYVGADESNSKFFNEAMACSAKSMVRNVIETCPEVFEGIGNLVDVGGGNGTAISLFVKAFPWIKGTCFDLPQAVNAAEKIEGIEYVGGDMFVSVPKADALYLMRVMHDWGDEYCIKILKNCRAAIAEDKGKVIIVDMVINDDEEDKLKSMKLTLDMLVMAHAVRGKERTLKEWDYLLKQGGFSRFNVVPIGVYQSLIEAFPN